MLLQLTHFCATAVLKQDNIGTQAMPCQLQPTGKHKAGSQLCVFAAISGSGGSHTSGFVYHAAGAEGGGQWRLQDGLDRPLGSASMSSLPNLGVLQGREVDDNDTFKYNEGFTAALFRIKINSIQLKETQEENKKTNDQVLQDRQYQVGARGVECSCQQ